jgi:hypothetical protein
MLAVHWFVSTTRPNSCGRSLFLRCDAAAPPRPRMNDQRWVSAYSTAAKRLMGCSAELTREWCINVLDAPLEIFAKECPLSVCGPRRSCHARRGPAFCDARVPGCAYPRRHLVKPSQELRAFAAVVFEHVLQGARRMSRSGPNADLDSYGSGRTCTGSTCAASLHATCAKPLWPMQDGAS